MKTQISRWSFDPTRRRSGVYQQQGRMITDADLNELMELLRYRIDGALGEVLGSGMPRTADIGLVVSGATGASAPLLRRGTLYVNGVRARLEPSVPLAAGVTTFALNQQADYPLAPAWPGGSQTVYADVWDLATTALQDPGQLDPGLHGADTATRTQTLVQVKWCPSTVDPLTSPLNPSKGNATLQVEIRAGSSAPDPCDPCAAEIALDERVGNYVFRLEVHDVQGPANAPGTITLKWSSENGAEQHTQASVPPEFKRGDWIYEFYSDSTERQLGVQLSAPVPARTTLSDGWPAAASPLLDANNFPYVRRWDGCCTLALSGTTWSLSAVAGAIAMDKGIALTLRAAGATPTHGNFDIGNEFVAYLRGLTLRLTLAGKSFLAGDYWLATVREDAAEASRVEQSGHFEETGSGSATVRRYLPLGITHHYLFLARVNAAAVQPLTDAETRRLSIPPLANLSADRIGYSTGPAGGAIELRWQDVLEDTTPGALPQNVQQALDGLVNKLESSDIGYAVPTCPTVNTLRSLSWTGTTPTPQKIKDLLDFLLCNLDATRIPYQTGATTAPSNQTVRQWLDTIPTKVNRSGDVMSGGLAIGGSVVPPANTLQVAGDCLIGGNLTIQGDTTTINVAQLEVEDSIIRVNKYPPQATPQPVNGGMEVFRGGAAANPNAQILWDEADDRWKVGVEGNLLPIAIGEPQDFVTGMVEFQNMLNNVEMISGVINPGLGPGPVCVHLGLDGGAAPTMIGDTGYARDVVYRAAVNIAAGTFQVLARRNTGGPSALRVRWWALKPGRDLGTLAVPIAVTVTPATVTLAPAGTQQFTATVAGATLTAVTWSTTGGGTINATTGLYTASTPGSFQVTATSNADQSRSGAASVTITGAVAVTAISPAGATMFSGRTQQFAATVIGTTNTAINWSASAGSIGATTGLFTAPLAGGSVTITATSAADPTKSLTTTVTVTHITVAVSPPSANINTAQSQQFSASVTGTTTTTVTWSATGGSISATGLFTPTAAGNFTVTATSTVDTNKKGTAAVAVVTAKDVTKDNKDDKDDKDRKDKTEKDPEKLAPVEKLAPIETTPLAGGGGRTLGPADDTGLGRSFIRPDERPDLGLPAGGGNG